MNRVGNFGYPPYLEAVSSIPNLSRRRALVKGTQLIDTWEVKSLYRAGSLLTVATEIAKYKFDSVGIQKVRWNRGGTEPASEYTFFYGKGNGNLELGTCFLYVRESYQQLRG
jgi:hypothetical protein